MRNSARCYRILSRAAAITLAWRLALLLGLLGVMLGSTPAEAQPPFAYVTNGGSTTVSVINAATNIVVATVPVGSGPEAVAITPDGTDAYVANQGSNTVSVIATATNTVVATVPVGSGPGAVAITPDGTDAYVANQGSNTVSVIATASNSVVATVPVGSAPSAVAITPDGTQAYVANQGSNTVSVIDTATNAVVTTVPVGVLPSGVAITPDGTHAYVTNRSSNTVSVIDTSTNSVVVTVPVGSFPDEVAITLDGTLAYVTNNGSNNVSVIDTATNAVFTTCCGGPAPDGVAITPVKFACPLSQGFWKNHLDAWPVTALTLGSQTYTQAELLTLFDTPPGGDASVILAHQLIGAKLNVAIGSSPVPISGTIADADMLLSQFSGKLPYTISTSSAIGQQMVNDAKVLDRYNNGRLTPDCQR